MWEVANSDASGNQRRRIERSLRIGWEENRKNNDDTPRRKNNRGRKTERLEPAREIRETKMNINISTNK